VLISSTQNIRQTASIRSTSGNIALIATDMISQFNGGDITTTSGDVLVEAGQNWTMLNDTIITAGGGDFDGKALAGDIALGQIVSTRAAITAGGSITDANGTAVNIEGTSLSLRAGGAIGGSNMNAGAIDTEIETFAASAGTGIHIEEANDLVIDTVQAVSVLVNGAKRVNFNSTTTDVVRSRKTDEIEDLTTTRNGSISVVASLGSITVNHGSNSAFGISAHGGGEIEVTALGSTGKVMLNAAVHSASGDISIFASDSVDVMQNVQTSGSGDVQIQAVSGNIALKNVLSVVQSGGDISLRAGSEININHRVESIGAGDIRITAGDDITIQNSIVSTANTTKATDETIVIESIGGNIGISQGAGSPGTIEISTDDVDGSLSRTGDVISLIANGDQSVAMSGKITIESPVTIRTDGGVAKKFGPRPAVGAPDTAFFQFISSPLPLEHDNVPANWNGANAYINAFAVLIGEAGEENLTVDIDWQDPEDDTFLSADEEDKDRRIAALQMIKTSPRIYNELTTDRIQHFLVEKGGPATDSTLENTNGQIIVGHLYTALDYTRFQNEQHRTTINIDFSVSHHESIQLKAASIAQDGPAQTVPGSVASSTDDRSTKSAADPKDPNGPEEDDIFENGIASFKIPTTTPAPPALFTSTFVPRADRPFNVAPPENQAAVSGQSTTEFGSGAVGGSVFSTEVYFQIRRQYETDGPAEVVVERITDSSLISSREAFEKFVQENPALQDGAGYEIWLISETGGQKVERPIVEFEISGGQPGTMNDAEPEGNPAQQLKELPFEQPAEEDENPQAPDPEIPQARLDVDSAPSSFAHEATSPEINASTIDHTVTVVSFAVESEQETATLVSEALNPSAAALMGLMVRRFRKRQQESATTQSTFSRAARFQRKHSSPNAEFEVRGSSDV
jgi:hypothetical protein